MAWSEYPAYLANWFNRKYLQLQICRVGLTGLEMSGAVGSGGVSPLHYKDVDITGNTSYTGISITGNTTYTDITHAGSS